MSIFKESLPNYIKDQLSIREGIIRMGMEEATFQNAPNQGGRMSQGNARTTKGDVTLSKAAFYTNTANKSCTVRMASLVDLQSKEMLDEDGVNGRIEKDFGGPGMALTYILEGGTIIKGIKDNKIERVGDETKRYYTINQKSVMRRGFPTQKWNLGGTYGDPIIRADAKDGYGIVPMPGITDVSIKTKSAYGSLREAKVSFECHNLRQLEILELLYMRPGYPILLEWGWSMYVDNNGHIQNAPQWISEKPEFWDASKISQEAISANIIQKRKETDGNYDGILGFCKNFSYTARPDGGFKCSTELMAVGETINAIKGNMVTAVTSNGDKFDMPKIMHVLNAFVDGIIGLAGGETTTSSGIKNYEDPGTQEDYLNKLANTIGGTTGDVSGAKSKLEGDNTEDLEALKDAFNFKKSKDARSAGTSTAIHGYKYADIGQEFVEDKMIEKGWFEQAGQGAKRIDSMKKKSSGDPPEITDALVSEYRADWDSVTNTWKNTNNNGKQDYSSEDGKQVQTWMENRDFYWDEAIATVSKEIESTTTAKVIQSEEYGDIMKPGVHLIGPQHDATSKPKFQGKMGFIRLDSFCKLINRLVIPDNTKPSQNGKILAFQTNHFSANGGLDPDGKAYFDTYKLNAYNEKFFQLFDEEVDLDISVDPFVCLFPHQIANMEDDSFSDDIEFYRPVKDVSGYSVSDSISDKDFWSHRFPHKTEDIDRSMRDRAKRSVGNIYLNLDMLHKQCKKLQDQTKNEHFSLGQFMFNVLEEVNKATGGNHKLALINNHEFPNIINIVDINGSSAHDSYDAVHEIKVQSTDSVVRKFSFNTEIPSAMSATIAVAAQNPNDANALDEVTFAALNRGIRNRLYRPAGPNTPDYSKSEIEKKSEKLQKEIEELGQKLGSIKYYNRSIKNRTQQKDDDQRNERTNNYRSTLIRVQTLTDILAQKDDRGLPKQLPPSSTPIPIKVDLEFDGIGGMVIGQLFRINTDRLPRHYRNKNIIFLVKSEQQKIGKNGDWTTKISDQMQLFETTPTKSKYGPEMAEFLKKALRKEEKKKKEEELNNVKPNDNPQSEADKKAAADAVELYDKHVNHRKYHVVRAFKGLRTFLMRNTGWDWRTIRWLQRMADSTMLTMTEINAIYSWGSSGRVNNKEKVNWAISFGGKDDPDYWRNSNYHYSLTAYLEEKIGNRDVPKAKCGFRANGKSGRADRRAKPFFGHTEKEIPNYGKYTPASVSSILSAVFPDGFDSSENLGGFKKDAEALPNTIDAHRDKTRSMPTAADGNWQSYFGVVSGATKANIYTFGGERYNC